MKVNSRELLKWNDKTLSKWNSVDFQSVPLLVSGYKVFLDFGNINSYSGAGNLVTNLGSAVANGTIYNGTFNSSGGGSMGFNGTSSYIDLGSHASIADFTGLTASIWFNIASNSTPMNLLYKSDSNNSAGYFVDLRPTYNELGLQIVNSSSNLRKYISRSNLQANQWVNLVCTWSGGVTNTSAIVYLNGSSSYNYETNTSGSGTHGSDLAQALTIGKSKTGSAANFTGLISNVLIYDRALTGTEVAQNYNAIKSRFEL